LEDERPRRVRTLARGTLPARRIPKGIHLSTRSRQR
jgi:hypothetical protein